MSNANSTSKPGVLELHLIQNFPPSNLNRDDIGQPKSAEFGGVRRARISSQCQKRAIRLHRAFEQATGVKPSERTKMLSKEIAERLRNASKSTEDAQKAATLFAEIYSGKLDKKRKNETAVLIYFSETEYELVVDKLLKNWDVVIATLSAIASSASSSPAGEDGKSAKGKKAKAEKVDISAFDNLIKELMKETKGHVSAPDIALYGRMLAARPETDIDAACQVAHAISTHEVRKADLDYYTAMDDVKQRMKDPGAGFLDVAYFNSACFYRYMRIDITQLEKTLDDHDMATKTVEGFMRAAEAAVPSGKINSHAQHVRPSFMLAVLRPLGSDGWNLVNAFEKPIRPNGEDSVLQSSVKTLDKRFESLRQFYGEGETPILAVALPDGAIDKALLSKPLADQVKNLNDWVDAIISQL